MLDKRKKIFEYTLLLLIITAAAVLRFYGAVHATAVPYPSEENVLKSVEYMTQTVSLDTNFFNHPDTVLLYAVLIVINVVSFIKTGNIVCGSISSVISGNPGSEYFAEHMIEFLYTGRCVNVLFSLVTIFICYLIGNRFKPRFGILAALFASLFPSYNIWSGLMLSDTCLTMLITTAVYFSICYMQNKKNIYMVFTIIACALAAIQKYPGLISVCLVVYLICNKNIQFMKEKEYKNYMKSVIVDGIKAAGIFIVTCMAAAPALVIHFPYVIKAFVSEAGSVHLGADGLGYFGNIWFYIKVFINQAGLLTVVGSIAGGLFLIRNKSRLEYLPVFAGWLMMLLMSGLGLHWERWSLMFHTSFLLLCAYAVVVLFNSIEVKRLRNIAKTAAVVLMTYVILITGTNTFVEHLCRICEDTRIAGTDAVAELNINKDNTCHESYTVLSNGMSGDMTSKECEYVMISSYNYDRYYNSADRYPEMIEFYNWLENDCEKVYEITPWNKNRVMMDASIYTGFKLRTGVSQLVTNIKDIADYYNSSDEKYYGPVIKAYKVKHK